MRVVRHTDVAAFADVAVPLLTAAEAENILPLGICAGLRSAVPAPPPYLAIVEDGGRPVSVAMMTPPRKLVVSSAPHAALDALCADLVDGGVPVPGVHGRAVVAETFSALWRRRTGEGASLERGLRIYQLTSVISPRSIAGQLRQAVPADLPLVEAWGHAFVTDTGLIDEAESIPNDVRRAVRDSQLFVWDEGTPTAMAAWTGPTPNGVRVTLVYTPSSLRGHGRASACVAALSARLLASGRAFCFLFTDLGNPTSNRIYAKIGYEPVCDVHEYRFERHD